MAPNDNKELIRRWLKMAVLRATIGAIHTGEFYGVNPTGRRVSFTAIVIYRILGGKIAESWGELDFLGLFRQLRST